MRDYGTSNSSNDEGRCGRARTVGSQVVAGEMSTSGGQKVKNREALKHAASMSCGEDKNRADAVFKLQFFDGEDEGNPSVPLQD
jgi:hypothetical protein